MKNLILPAVLMFAAVGAAFATEKDQSTPPITEKGAYWTGTICNKTPMDCTTDPGLVCTFSGHSLQRFVNDTQCGIELHKVQ